MDDVTEDTTPVDEAPVEESEPIVTEDASDTGDYFVPSDEPEEAPAVEDETPAQEEETSSYDQRLLDDAIRYNVPNAKALAEAGLLGDVLQYASSVYTHAVGQRSEGEHTPDTEAQPAVDGDFSQFLYKFEKLDADEYPGLAEEINGMNEAYAKHMARMEAQFKELNEFREKESMRSLTTQLDAMWSEFNATQPDFKELVGEGSMDGLSDDQFGARIRILEDMNFLRERNARLGRPAQAESELMLQAVKREFVDRVAELERNRIRSQANSRSSSTRPPSKANIKSEQDDIRNPFVDMSPELAAMLRD